ncbi:MAG: hypothetical protein AMS15_07775 [Planctomycetes bacterium DG_23]|nr:MAG: hypothetical protein AMS15_07775 [Planctomycetes bacterium DG_23]
MEYRYADLPAVRKAYHLFIVVFFFGVILFVITVIFLHKDIRIFGPLVIISGWIIFIGASGYFIKRRELKTVLKIAEEGLGFQDAEVSLFSPWDEVEEVVIEYQRGFWLFTSRNKVVDVRTKKGEFQFHFKISEEQDLGYGPIAEALEKIIKRVGSEKCREIVPSTEQ